MISEAKLKANRSNARKSTGPRTDRGKLRSSRNAIKHGLTARTDVIPGDPYRSYRVGGTDKIVVRANRPLCTCKGEVSPLSGDNRHLEVSPLSGDNRHLEVSPLSGDNVCEQEGSHCREFPQTPVLAPNASARPPLYSPHVKRFADSARSYKSFRRQLLLELSPQSFLDRELADRIIGDLWRLKRIPKLESAIMKEMRHKEPSVPPALAELAIALDQRTSNLTDTYDSPSSSDSSRDSRPLRTCEGEASPLSGDNLLSRSAPADRLHSSYTPTTGWLQYSEHFSRFSRYESSLERSLFRSLNDYREHHVSTESFSEGGMDSRPLCTCKGEASPLSGDNLLVPASLSRKRVSPKPFVPDAIIRPSSPRTPSSSESTPFPAPELQPSHTPTISSNPHRHRHLSSSPTHRKLGSFRNFTSIQTAQPSIVPTPVPALPDGPCRREPRSPRADLTQHSDRWAWTCGPVFALTERRMSLKCLSPYRFSRRSQGYFGEVGAVRSFRSRVVYLCAVSVAQKGFVI